MFLYFVQSCDSVGLVKIGFAKDPAARVAELQVGCPAQLRVLGTVKLKSERHARNTERAVHALFAFCHRRGEWFAPNQHLREFPVACEAFGLEQAFLLARAATQTAARRHNRHARK